MIHVDVVVGRSKSILLPGPEKSCKTILSSKEWWVAILVRRSISNASLSRFAGQNVWIDGQRYVPYLSDHWFLHIHGHVHRVRFGPPCQGVGTVNAVIYTEAETRGRCCRSQSAHLRFGDFALGGGVVVGIP